MKLALLAAAATALSGAAAHANPAPAAPSTLVARDLPSPGVKAFRFRSEKMGRNYDVVIRFPRQYMAHPDKRFPALLITDGNRFFPAAMAALNAVEGELAAPMILIAVGTPFEEGPDAYNRRRVHEFSPPGWDMKDAFGQGVAQSCAGWKVPLAQCTGGAPEFLRFLSGELIPRLASDMRIDRDRLALGGVSAGGFFAAWASFQPHSPFSNYILSSPAFAYGDGEIFREEARFAEGRKDFPVGIYMSSGSLEIDHPYLEGVGKVVSGQAHLGGVLRGRSYPGLRLHSEIHQGLGHLDAASTAYARGLRLLMAPGAGAAK